MRQRLEVRQSQQLVMTPQLRQSIEMLQMSAPELERFLADAVEANPLLELAPNEAAPEGPPPEPPPLEPPPPEAPGHGALDTLLQAADPSDAATLDGGRDNLFEPERGGSAPPADAGGYDRLSAGPTLSQDVARQIGAMRLDPPTASLAAALAGELDEDGYLRVDPAATAARLGVAERVVEPALAALQACEPTGVGARGLAECLALQLAERDRLDPAMRTLLGMLAALPETPPDAIAAACGVDRADVADMVAELRALDPRPGLAVGASLAEPVRPDVLVAPDGAGGWRVSLNPDATPRLIVDREYAARVRADGGEAAAFLAECAQTASWLTRSLDQRARTIVNVAAAIVQAQAAFLDEGPRALRPLTQRHVADTLGVHESTVSRVTANKFMLTPSGVVELRAFFSAAVPGSAGGDAQAAESVRVRIKALVAEEPAGRPLSDEHIVEALREHGVEVARRTVAKYREILGIPSSSKRRRAARGAL